MVSRGRFFTFEGPEGAGKSTQLRLLADRLQAAGERVLITREPGGTPLGQRLRMLLLEGDTVDPRAELLLMAADRAQHVAEVIEPALAAGRLVLCDRYIDSTRAYQGGGLGLDQADIEAANRLGTGGLMPDLTFVFLLDPAEGLRRKGETIDRIEQRSLDFHQRVHRTYAELCRLEPERCIPFEVDDLDAAQVHAQVYETAAAYLSSDARSARGCSG